MPKIHDERFKEYRKTSTVHMRPYEPGEDLANIAVSHAYTPEEGGMIAINPVIISHRWYVDKKDFEDNYQSIDLS